FENCVISVVCRSLAERFHGKPAGFPENVPVTSDFLVETGSAMTASTPISFNKINHPRHLPQSAPGFRPAFARDRGSDGHPNPSHFHVAPRAIDYVMSPRFFQDPMDGLGYVEVGAWATKEHASLKDYVRLT
ncbi:MAG: hypothetical protein ACRCUC_14715, partial [Aestuariivirga sp.]